MILAIAICKQGKKKTRHQSKINSLLTILMLVFIVFNTARAVNIVHVHCRCEKFSSWESYNYFKHESVDLNESHYDKLTM